MIADSYLELPFLLENCIEKKFFELQNLGMFELTVICYFTSAYLGKRLSHDKIYYWFLFIFSIISKVSILKLNSVFQKVSAIFKVKFIRLLNFSDVRIVRQ